MRVAASSLADINGYETMKLLLAFWNSYLLKRELNGTEPETTASPGRFLCNPGMRGDDSSEINATPGRLVCNPGLRRERSWELRGDG